MNLFQFFISILKGRPRMLRQVHNPFSYWNMIVLLSNFPEPNELLSDKKKESELDSRNCKRNWVLLGLSI